MGSSCITIEDTYAFLLRSTVPEITDKKKLPKDLQWKNTHDKEMKKRDSDYHMKKLVWECISRAHRDVLSGRKNVVDYSQKGNNDLNPWTMKLYEAIVGTGKVEKLSSKNLIDQLLGESEKGIGPIQKLVNMTLKYMFLMNLYGFLRGYYVDPKDCDCPLDSRILISLHMPQKQWTRDFVNDEATDQNRRRVYEGIQELISEKCKNSKLAYDFDNWNNSLVK